MSHRDFPGPRNAQDLGLVIADNTDEKRLRGLLRRLRRYNPVPHMAAAGYGPGYRMLLIDTLGEDPVSRDSQHSYFVQLSDVNAFFLFQSLQPSGYVKRKGAQKYFHRLEPILCKIASTTDPLGIVRL